MEVKHHSLSLVKNEVTCSPSYYWQPFSTHEENKPSEEANPVDRRLAKWKDWRDYHVLIISLINLEKLLTCAFSSHMSQQIPLWVNCYELPFLWLVTERIFPCIVSFKTWSSVGSEMWENPGEDSFSETWLLRIP